MTTDQHDLPADVRDALARGDKIDAIRLLRAHMGLGLKEARDVIEGRQPVPAARVPAHGASSAVSAEVLAAIRRGNKIEAIKLVRDQTGLGLKEAKDIVDAASDECEH